MFGIVNGEAPSGLLLGVGQGQGQLEQLTVTADQGHYFFGGTGVEPHVVEIALGESRAFTLRGKLDFVDNAVNRASGTIRARAIVPNPGGFLSPGAINNAIFNAIGRRLKDLPITRDKILGALA